MKVTPKSEKEIYEANLLPPDWYPFTIGDAVEKTSKKGNEMIEMNVRIYKGEGFVFVRDWLMDGNSIGAAKLRHCADACGVLAEYEAGSLNAESLADKEGYAKVVIEKSKDAAYSDKNKIVDYAKEKPQPKAKGAAVPAKDEEDDISWD